MSEIWFTIFVVLYFGALRNMKSIPYFPAGLSILIMLFTGLACYVYQTFDFGVVFFAVVGGLFILKLYKFIGLIRKSNAVLAGIIATIDIIGGIIFYLTMAKVLVLLVFTLFMIGFVFNIWIIPIPFFRLK